MAKRAGGPADGLRPGVDPAAADADLRPSSRYRPDPRSTIPSTASRLARFSRRIGPASGWRDPAAVDRPRDRQTATGAP